MCQYRYHGLNKVCILYEMDLVPFVRQFIQMGSHQMRQWGIWSSLADICPGPMFLVHFPRTDLTVLVVGSACSNAARVGALW